MKRYSLAIAITALTLFAGNTTIAQDQKEKDKDKEKKEKLDVYEELIIRKKSDKDEKVTIEIIGGDIRVNGKPMDEYDNDNISIRKSRSGRAVTVSPFRRQGGGAINFGDRDSYSIGSDRAFLGISTETVSGKAGARVLTVGEKSAAEKAGLKKGDIITKIDQEKIEGQEDVSKVIRSHKPDDKISIFIKRDGKEQVINATLGKMGPTNFSYSSPESFVLPDMENFRNFNFDFNENGRGMSWMGKGRLGIKAQDTEDGKGVKVLEVVDESAAENAGIEEDDVITDFDGKAVNSADELASAATASKEKAAVTVKLLRNGKPQTIEIKTPRKLKTANL